MACDFPELKLVGIHVGIPWTDEMIAMAWKHPNVYIGCDAHSPKYWPESFVHYINSYGQDKVLFASGFPVLGFERTLQEVANLKSPPRAFAQVSARKHRTALPDQALGFHQLQKQPRAPSRLMTPVAMVSWSCRCPCG